MMGGTADSLRWRYMANNDAHTVRRFGKWICLALAVGLATGLIAVAVIHRTSRSISGKVISATTKLPVENVMVSVQSGLSSEETGLGSYVRTDKEGRFVAKARGKVLISAWKPGYAPRHISPGDAPDLTDHDISLELRELAQTNLVAEQDELISFKPGDGFCFELGKVVSADSPDADVLLRRDESDMTKGSIEARGNGGILYQPYDEKLDFDNSPEAPLTGYEVRCSLVQPLDGLYFIRTRDGNHYVKCRILVQLAYPFNGLPARLSFEDLRLIWAYQQDGTRNLEIAPSKDLSFPLEKFGFKRESLRQ